MRVKFSMPPNVHFSTQLMVRVTDLNYGGHVGNEMFLAYAQQARVEWLNSWGYGELTLAGKGIIMIDAMVMYQAEALGGDILNIELAVDNLSLVGFDLYYQFSNLRTGKEVARIKTGILCFDYDTKKIAPLPEEVVKKMQALDV